MKKYIFIIFLVLCVSCIHQPEKNSDYKLNKNDFKGCWVLYSVNDTIVNMDNCAQWPNGFVVDDYYTCDFYRYGFHYPEEKILTFTEYKDEWKIFYDKLYFSAGFKSISNWMASSVYNKLNTYEHISRLVRYADVTARLINIENNIMTVEYIFKKSPDYNDIRYKAKFKKDDLRSYKFI